MHANHKLMIIFTNISDQQEAYRPFIKVVIFFSIDFSMIFLKTKTILYLEFMSEDNEILVHMTSF